MDELSLAVVGVDYPNRDGTNRRFELMQLEPGDPVELRPEPRNRHDPHAVAVFSARGLQLGYLSAERAPWIGRRLRHGEEVAAVFQGLAGAVAHVRVRFGGGAPTLPRKQEVGASNDQPIDPDGPDWGA